MRAMTTLENQGGRGPLFSRALVGREVRETCWLAMPIVFSQLGQVALGFTDTVMVGRLGPEALAAMAIGGGFYMVFYIFGIGVLHGVTALASQAYGARDPRGVRRISCTSTSFVRALPRRSTSTGPSIPMAAWTKSGSPPSSESESRHR